MTMRVLQLSTYPARIPRHGGQARVANIRAMLEGAGHEVRTLAVYEPAHYGGEAVESVERSGQDLVASRMVEQVTR